MRIDQLYNAGGFNPAHPSGNVLDEFLHEDEAAGRVRVRHYDTTGRKLTDRLLTAAERRLLLPLPGEASPDPAEAAAVRMLGDADVAARIEAGRRSR